MKFQSDKKRLTRLSDDISDDNRYKQILLDMERPVSKAPVYSFLVISLTIYFWMYFLKMYYFKAPHLEIACCVMGVSTLGIFLTYKKEIMGRVSFTLPFNIITIFLLIFSSFVVSFDSGTYSNEEIIKSLLITSTVDKKSYLSLAVLAFFTLGISITYPIPYHKQESFYQINAMKERFKEVYKIRFCAIFCILIWPIFLQETFNQSGKGATMGVFGGLAIPGMFYTSFIYPRYLRIYKKAKGSENKRGY